MQPVARRVPAPKLKIASADQAASLRGSPAGGLIVESSFTSLADMAREVTFGWLPVGLLMSQKFDSMSKMAKVTMPVLVVARRGGSLRAFALQPAALRRGATAPKELLLVEGGGHNNSMRTGADRYREALGKLFGLSLKGAEGRGAAVAADGSDG